MMEMQFERDRSLIEREFIDRDWSDNTGLSPERLEADCRLIWERLKDESIQMRRAKVFCYLLEHARLEVRSFECFADQIDHNGILPKLTWEWHRETNAQLVEDLKPSQPAVECRALTGDRDYGHTCPDWNVLLTLGYPGILARLEKGLETAVTPAQKEYFTCGIMVHEAVLAFIRRLADLAESKAAESARMLDVAADLRALANGAPETLHQALQLTLITYILQQEIEGANVRVLGRFDMLFGAFYEADLAAGRMTRAQAKEMMQYYLCRWNARDVVANIPITLCGRDQQGRQVANDFTRLVIETYGELDLISPKFHIRYSEDMPEDVLRQVLRLIRAGSSSFVFCNDDVVEAAMVRIGQKPEHARNYVMVGCYESTAPGYEVACTCNGRVSFPKAVEYAMTGGVDMLTGQQIGLPTAPDFATFDEFMEAVRKQLISLSDRCMERIVRIEADYPDLFSAPLFSATFASCIEKGCDIFSGGAVYNNSSINAFGIATAADALASIRKLVYEDGELTLPELTAILRSNWEGHEKLRLRCLRRMPKYGTHNASVDALAADLMATASGRISGAPNGRGGVFRCGAFSIDWRYDFGEHAGASADGRRAGEPISKNWCASLGGDTEGATALVQSASCFDASLLPNGTVLDVVLHQSAVTGEEGLDVMAGLIRTFAQGGGLAIQFNVLDAEVLRRAQADPDKYPNLQVRLCGWNVRFVNLSRKEQDELILQASA